MMGEGEGGLYFLGEVSLFSIHFLILKCKISKIACGALIFNIHIFRFATDAGLQVDIGFNTESKEQFLFTPQWALKTNQTHETAFFFIHLVGLDGPPNHPVSKAFTAFCVNVNKHASY